MHLDSTYNQRMIYSRDNLSNTSTKVPARLLKSTWLFLVIGLILLGISPITDSDVFMHLALGRELFRSGALPVVDPFIVSQFRDWTTWHEWGGYALIYSLYSLLGYAGLTALKLSLVGGALYPSFRALRRTDAVFSWPQLIIFFCGVVALGFRFSERTSLIGDVLLTLSIAVVLMDWNREVHSKKVWFLPLIVIVWTNVHASFPLAWGVVIIWMFSSLITNGWQRSKAAIPVAIACFAAPLLNPRGIGGVIAPFSFLGFKQEFLQKLVSEWRPTFDGSTLGFVEIWFFGLFLILSTLLILLSLKQGQVRQKTVYVLLAVFLIALGISANRFIPTAILGLILISNSVPVRVPSVGIRASAVLSIFSLGFVVLILSGHYVRVGMPHQLGVGVDYRVFPNEETIDRIVHAHSKGPIRNDFYFGCYLAWMLDGQRKIFVHGYVTDMRVLQEFFSGVGASRENFDLDASRWGTGAILLERSAVTVKYLEILKDHPDWRIAAIDDASLLFLRK